MFTGIITGVGRIAAVHDLGSSLDHGKRLTIEAPAGYLDDVGLGDSIALNGACMTVTTLTLRAAQFTIDISAESLGKTAGSTGPARSTWKRPARERPAGRAHRVRPCRRRRPRHPF
jgi:riboflavin synthase